MTDRQLRARVLLEEAKALGIDLGDLLAAAGTATAAMPAVASYVASIASTFTPVTAKTYDPYWRLLVAHLGQHRIWSESSASSRRSDVAGVIGLVDVSGQFVPGAAMATTLR